MTYQDFNKAYSYDRISRYLTACNGDKNKAMLLYKYNLRLSQEIFTIVTCLEVVLRNAIDRQLTSTLGNDWLKDSIDVGGIFDNPRCQDSAQIIRKAYRKVLALGTYQHSKLVSSLDFGTWKYMFGSFQYRVTGRTLLSIFPNRPRSSATMQYNNTYIFNELDKANTLRNRIAHNEPIIFTRTNTHADTTYILTEYNKIFTMLTWLGFDPHSMFYGLDHVQQICDKLNKL